MQNIKRGRVVLSKHAVVKMNSNVYVYLALGIHFGQIDKKPGDLQRVLIVRFLVWFLPLFRSFIGDGTYIGLHSLCHIFVFAVSGWFRVHSSSSQLLFCFLQYFIWISISKHTMIYEHSYPFY